MTTAVSFDQYLYGLGQQESGGNYSAVNASSGALGKYQVMPSNLTAWTKQILGRVDTAAQFLASPADQDAVARGINAPVFAAYGARGAASAWYSGDPTLSENTRSQSGGPSIKGYVDSVVALAQSGGGAVRTTASGAVTQTVGLLGDTTSAAGTFLSGVLGLGGKSVLAGVGQLLFTGLGLLAGVGLVVLGTTKIAGGTK